MGLRPSGYDTTRRPDGALCQLLWIEFLKSEIRNPNSKINLAPVFQQFFPEEFYLDHDACQKIIDNIARVIVGKKPSIELLLVALLADGYVLLEDVPGMGKTLLAKCLAKSIGGTFKRVQFTPDLLPSDVTGFNVYSQAAGRFEFQPGPVMAHVLLADEINRTIPRTQSSLLESMEERQVTVDGQTYPLPAPFFVIATQNPIELEGTFPLPEAQLDRFLLKIKLGYPQREEEIKILARFRVEDPLRELGPVIDPEAFIELQAASKQVRVSEPVAAYVIDIVRATRDHAALQYGASPRASLGLMRAAQGLAGLKARSFVLPDDVKELAEPVLSHRLILKEEERLRGTEPQQVIEDILGRLPVPVGKQG
ncbi:FIG022979: MoxR-like ATPases [Olavius algarvensis Delta 1 endosymbiont]|nr:FIG022979: MoxR-like ATPases [Olavius algarvensis Delta 1 endosymbiont]